MAVVSHINRQGGSRSRTLDRLARCLLLWSQDRFLSLRAVHVPGILNLAADFLSRQKLRPGEWMLNRQTVSQIWDLFGKAEVDLFASQESSQCPLPVPATEGSVSRRTTDVGKWVMVESPKSSSLPGGILVTDSLVSLPPKLPRCIPVMLKN